MRDKGYTVDNFGVGSDRSRGYGVAMPARTWVTPIA